LHVTGRGAKTDAFGDILEKQNFRMAGELDDPGGLCRPPRKYTRKGKLGAGTEAAPPWLVVESTICAPSSSATSAAFSSSAGAATSSSASSS
jgi:hypothetical protein